MSLQQAREYWTYLHDQAGLKKREFINTPSGSSYKDEMRTEAETYEGIIESFAENFEDRIRRAQDISHGLEAAKAGRFLKQLDRQLIECKAGLEHTRRKKQEALAEPQDISYSDIKRIYNATENNKERQIMAVENARESFMNILQDK